MEGPDLKQVVRTIEGVIALCLGSAGRVVWVNQTDAAAFNDGDKVYLPAPTGSHPGEYDLLLAIALREVAKVSFSQSGHIGTLGNEARPYAECVEEARLKTMLSHEYRGSPAIFDKAAGIAAGIFANGAAEVELDAAHANRLAIWAAAHDAALGTAGSADVLTQLRGLAIQQTPAEQLDAAIGIARQAPAAASTEMSAALGVEIAEALRSQPEQQDQQQDQEQDQQPSDGQQDQQDKQQDQQPPEGPQDPQDPQEQEPGAEGQEQAGQGGDQDDSQPQDQQAGSGVEEQSNNADQAGDKDKGGETDSPKDGDGGADTPQENAADGQQGGGSPGEAGGSDDESDKSGEAGGSGQQPSAGSSSEGGSSDATPKGGTNGSSGDDTGDEAPQAESTESSDGTGKAGAQGSDILSDALAKTRGHQKARDVSAQAEALQQDSSAESGAELSDGQLAALKAGLDNPVEPGDAVYAVAESEAAAGDDEACQLDIAGQLGGDGLAEDASPGCNVLTGVPARLVSVLTREYQDKRRRPFQRAVGGQQIAVSHAWRLKAMGDVRVFRKKAPACGIDAAVSFLLDRSLSMDDVGMEAAAGVTYAMALAHQRIAGTQVSIDVFPGRYSESEQMLGFKQNLRAAEERLKTIVAEGGTPMGSAIAKRLTLLLATRSLKKAMYVITDGRPNFGELELTRHLIREATAAGVVMIGVGINAEVGDLFPISAKVAGVDDLADALERLFKTELVERLAA